MMREGIHTSFRHTNAARSGKNEGLSFKINSKMPCHGTHTACSNADQLEIDIKHDIKTICIQTRRAFNNPGAASIGESFEEDK